MFRNSLIKSIATILSWFILHSVCLAKMVEADCLQNDETSSLSKLIQQAEDLFNASLFLEAIPIYQDILHKLEEEETFNLEKSIRDNIDSKVRYRLAQALFHIKDYPSAIDLFQDHKISENHPLFLGIAYRNNGDFEKAIHTFQSFIENHSEKSTLQLDKAHFELALSFYLKDDYLKAEEAFEKVLKMTKNDRLQILSYFYLTRIKMRKANLNEAAQHLNQASALIKNDDLLKYESAFLQGELSFHNKDFPQAILYFEKAIPQQNPHHTKWYADTLHYLGICYFKMAAINSNNLSEESKKEYLFKSGQLIEKLLKINPSERAWMAQGEYYFTIGKLLKDEDALKKAEEIFSDPQKISSKESYNKALLTRAQTHLNYHERDRRLRQLTQSSHANSPFYGEAWYIRGLNDLEEGQSLKQVHKEEEAHKMFERAAASLEQASQLLKIDNPALSAKAILLQIYSYHSELTEKDHSRALKSLNQLWEENAKLLKALPDPLEAHILYSRITSSISDETKAIEILQQGLSHFPKSPQRDIALNIMANLFYKKGHFDHAEEIFFQLFEEWPKSPLAAEALYRASQSAERLKKDKAHVRSYKQLILEKYPYSAIAPEAYFMFYSYQEYLQGDRTAIQHLTAFPDLYPESPFVLNAFFLLGLDNKRDLQSPEGKLLKKKNLIDAIDNFQDVETHFETLDADAKIPQDRLEHCLLVRYRAHLEKGLANYALANESFGTKKQIYLEYARETLCQLLQELANDKYHKDIMNSDLFWHLEEECTSCLSQIYITANQYKEAEELLSKILAKYKAAKITRGYFLSRTLSTQAYIEMRRQDYHKALEWFLQAEDAAKGRVLSTDQRLELLIQQSLCLKELNQLEKAILILSKVVNDDAISSLRIKAMLLRAEIYEKQERFELARKQLEATSKKGGEWALKAKEKLEKDYGYR